MDKKYSYEENFLNISLVSIKLNRPKKKESGGGKERKDEIERQRRMLKRCKKVASHLF